MNIHNRQNQWRQNSQLFSAIKFANLERVHQLLELGVDPDVRFSSVPALTLAVQVGKLEIVQELLKYGASHAQCDQNGATPLHYSCSKSQAPIADLLIEHRANINAGDNNRVTPLHNAVQHKNVHLIKCMLELGVSLNRRTSLGQTALHFAAQNSNVEAISMLIDAGAELDPIDSEDATPLWLALKSGHLDTIKVLIQSGARLDLPQQSFTPLDWAIHSENDYLVEMMLRHGNRHSNLKKAFQNLLEQKKTKLALLVFAQMSSFHSLLPEYSVEQDSEPKTPGISGLSSAVPPLSHLCRLSFRRIFEHRADKAVNNIRKSALIPYSLVSYVALDF